MNILSLFDGISIAKYAIESLNLKIDNYFSSEIDKYAIQVSKNNYSDILRLGDVRYIKNVKVPIDLLIGGFPCQSFSIAGNKKGIEDQRGNLVFEVKRLIDTVKPKFFVLENVNSMKKQHKDFLDELFNIKHIMLDASLVSAQQRKRIFWAAKLNECTNKYEQVIISQPKDRNIFLKDILQDGNVDRLKSYCLDANYYKGANWQQYKTKGRRQLVQVGYIGSNSQGNRIYSTQGKSVSLSANGGGRGAKTGLYEVEGKYRKLTPIECERLMSLPDDYTKGVSDTQRYKCLGNGFNAEIIKHIISECFK